MIMLESQQASDLVVQLIKTTADHIKINMIAKLYSYAIKNIEVQRKPSCWRYKVEGSEHWFYSEDEDPRTFEDVITTEIQELYEGKET